MASFGSVKFGGVKYEEDIIIHANGKVTIRKKKKSKDLKPIYGHTPLSERELDFLEEEKPEVIYVGKGYDSALPITPEALKIFDKYEPIMLPTPETMERLKFEKRRFVAFVHVTC